MTTITREQIERAELVLIVNLGGRFQWSSDQSPREVATCLRDVAALIEKEQR